MQGHGDCDDSSDARSEAPARLCSSAHDVVDPVRMEEQNNTSGSFDCTRDHTTNDESKVHGGSDVTDGGVSSDVCTGSPAVLCDLRRGVVQSFVDDKRLNTGVPPVVVRDRIAVGDSNLCGVRGGELPAAESVPTTTGFELGVVSMKRD